MKVGEFQKAIHVTSNSYARLMKQNGPTKGSGTDTYDRAFVFFKKRELQGFEIPHKKVKKADEDRKIDALDIRLEGEDNDGVEVYDTCDEIRRKIAAYLREDGVTRAGLLWEICKAFSGKGSIPSQRLQDFQSKSGPLSGNTSPIFYGAYVFFEKLRIKQGKKKSKARLEMEERWAAQGGIDSENGPGGFIVRKGEVPVMDKYGEVSIVPR